MAVYLNDTSSVVGAVKIGTPAAPSVPVVKSLSLERTRAVRMLKDVLSDQGLASRLEEHLHSTYGSIIGSPRYFEAVTRIFYALRVCVSLLFPMLCLSCDDSNHFVLP